MRGTVRWFNSQKGFGFITDSEGKDHFFHHSSIQMDGFRTLDEGDFVEFELGLGTKDREQAVNVQPIITRKIVAHELSKEKLHLQPTKGAMGDKTYMVLDANNIIQTGENGMSLEEVAGYVGLHYPV